MGEHFRLNSPAVVAETLDGEATIVDLKNGTYYALNHSGSFIWDLLVGGASPETITAALAGHYELDTDEAGRAVAALVQELTERGLVVPGGDEPQAPHLNGQATPGAEAYTAPALSVFTDMQELLLLDPVHEVDEAGWPGRR